MIEDALFWFIDHVMIPLFFLFLIALTGLGVLVLGAVVYAAWHPECHSMYCMREAS